MIPMTDTHLHFWDPSRQRLPWLEVVPDLNRAFTLQQYEPLAEQAGITRAIYVEVGAAPEERRREVASVTTLCESKASPIHAIVAAADPASPEFSADLQHYSSNPRVRGVRRVLHTEATPPGYCLQSSFVDGMRQLAARGLTFDLCMRRAELADAAELARRCPETTFIVDHCGNATAEDSSESPWAASLRAIAELPNCICKLSGIALGLGEAQELESLAPIVELCLKWFGADRVMFGTDWPVCTRRTTVVAWADLVRGVVSQHGDEVAQQVLNLTAERVYGLGAT